MGGVPKRGGLLPKDCFSAEERADSPGPGNEDCDSARPASGVCVAGESSNWAGVGIWRTAGVPACGEGIGEPSRAIEPARVDSAGERRPDCREDGTACGFDGLEPSPAMLPVCCVRKASFGYRCVTSALEEWRLQHLARGLHRLTGCSTSRWAARWFNTAIEGETRA